MHTPLVRRIAFHLIARMPPTVQADDLIQAGMIGLLEASGNYDASHGASFETFAGIRIRGAMLDEIRRLDWAPRSLFRKMRQVSEAMREIEHAEARDARDGEVAEQAGNFPRRIPPDSERCLGPSSVFSTEELGAGVDSQCAEGLLRR